MIKLINTTDKVIDQPARLSFRRISGATTPKTDDIIRLVPDKNRPGHLIAQEYTPVAAATPKYHYDGLMAILPPAVEFIFHATCWFLSNFEIKRKEKK